MPISGIAVGSAAEAGQADALRAALAEFISMLIFVFAGEGSGMAFSTYHNLPHTLNFSLSKFHVLQSQR